MAAIWVLSLTGACSGSPAGGAKPQATRSSPADAAVGGVVAAEGGAGAEPAAEGGAEAEAGGGGVSGHAATSGEDIGATHSTVQPTPAGAGGAAAGGRAGSGGAMVPPEDPTIRVTEIAKTGLASPSDLDFNPYVTDQLWVVNHADSSMLIIDRASTANPSVMRRIDAEGASHFTPNPLGIAFGGRETTIVDAQGKPVEGTFASCPDVDEDFMGPTLWASDLRIFGIAKPDREPPFNGPNTGREGPGSHIDMLHRTPTCIGIDWEGSGNLYWTYSGKLSMFVRYDFAKDHGIGNAEHTDGSVWRYPVKGLSYTPGTPSQLAYDREKKRVYMADPGNARVISFDPASATVVKHMSDNDNVDYLQTAFDLSGGVLVDLVPRTYGLKKPSGLTLHEGRVYVSDTATGTIHKFDTTGAPLGAAVIPGVKAGALAGMSFGPDGKLYFVDMAEQRVFRLENKF